MSVFRREPAVEQFAQNREAAFVRVHDIAHKRPACHLGIADEHAERARHVEERAFFLGGNPLNDGAWIRRRMVDLRRPGPIPHIGLRTENGREEEKLRIRLFGTDLTDRFR